MTDGMNVFFERLLELLKSDPELHAAAVDVLKAHSESERERGAYYREKRKMLKRKMLKVKP